MTAFALDSRPALKPLFRMQWEPVQKGHVLLYPEGMVQLNDSAAEILKYCDGQHSVQAICADLAQRFQAQDIQDDVMAFLHHAQERGWLQVT